MDNPCILFPEFLFCKGSLFVSRFVCSLLDGLLGRLLLILGGSEITDLEIGILGI